MASPYGLDEEFKRLQSNLSNLRNLWLRLGVKLTIREN